MKVVMRDGSGTIELTYLVEDSDRHGNVRVYVKKRGFPKKIRLKAPIGSQQFLDEYRAAFAVVTRAAIPPAIPSSRRVISGSLRWLFDRYMAGSEFKSLGKRTRYVREGILKNIGEVTLGDQPNAMLPWKLLEPRHIKRMRDDKTEVPHSANADIKALRRVFEWAMEDEEIAAPSNPAALVRYLKTKKKGWHTWTVQEVQQYWERHPVGTKARVAIDLLLFTGARRSDVVGLGRQCERGGRLCFTEIKGRDRIVKEHEFLILPQLRTSIDAAPSGHMTYLATEFGKPFTHAGFGNWFRRRCDEAGLKNCSAHGLRKAGATIAANNGANAMDLMAIFGWTDIKEAEPYIRNADRKRIADRAMHFLVPSAQNAV